MQTFLQQHSDHIHGVLSGLDRVRFRGTLRSICYADGLSRYLGFLKVLLVAFKSFFDGTARRLKLATERLAATTPVGKVVYLSGTIDKEAVVHDLIRQHAVADDFTGVIAVLSCVENCRSFQLYKNAATRMLELVSAQRKCLHYYIYLRHPRLRHDAHPSDDVVPDVRADLPERPRVAGSATRRGGHRVPAPRQQLGLGGGLPEGARPCSTNNCKRTGRRR